MFPLRRTDTPRKGFTLTELAIVLGIIGTILGAIWVASARVSMGRKVTKAQNEILNITQAVRNIYSNRSYSFASSQDVTATLKNMGVFDSDMIVSGVTSPQNPFGGATVVYTGAFSTSSFRVSMYGVTAAQCSQIASGIIRNATIDAAAPVGFTVAGGAVASINLRTTTMTPVSIQALCNNNTSASSPSVEFDFDLY